MRAAIEHRDPSSLPFPTRLSSPSSTLLAMFKSRFFPSLVAFAVSFLLTLLTSRFDLGRALGTGVITFGASFIGAAMYAGQAQYHLRQRLAELQEHIRALQRRRADVYEEWTVISTERDRIAASFDFLQMQLQQLQVKSTDLWQQKEALSWNLGDPKTATQAANSEHIATLKGQLAQLQQQEAELTRSLSTNLAAKQRADLSLKQTATELNQLQADVAVQQSLKRQLAQDMITLTDQKQQLEISVSSLQPQVHNLEHYKTELNQFLQSAEPKRQQIETGSKTLHSAIEQLQRQIVSLHSELIHLEGQIGDRRQQKDELDQELTSLKQRSKSAASSPASKATSPSNGTATATPPPARPSRPPTYQTIDATTTPITTPAPPNSPTRPVSFVVAPPLSTPAAASPTVPTTLPHPSGLPADWVELLTQLPEAEFQALRAIAEESNPAATLKQIAETHLTMPELLVDAINERALDTIGDIILETAAGVGAKVTPDHQEQVKRVIEAYLTPDF